MDKRDEVNTSGEMLLSFPEEANSDYNRDELQYTLLCDMNQPHTGKYCALPLT